MAVLRDGSDGIDRSRIQRVGRVFRDKSAMRLNLPDAEQLGKVGRLLQSVDPRRTIFRGNKADGRRTLLKIPHQRLRSDNFYGSRDQVVFGQQVADLLRCIRRELADVAVQREEAVGESHVVNALDRGLGIAMRDSPADRGPSASASALRVRQKREGNEAG